MDKFSKAVDLIKGSDHVNFKKIVEENLSLLHERDESNNTLLHISVDLDEEDIIKYLLYNGSCVDDININGWPPLFFAVRNSNREVIDLLLDYGVDINFRSKNGATVLHIASFYNKPKMVKFLTDKGVSVDSFTKFNETPLHFAARKHNIDVIKSLILYGADINLKDYDGKTIFDYIKDKTIQSELIFIYENREKLLEKLK